MRLQTINGLASPTGIIDYEMNNQQKCMSEKNNFDFIRLLAATTVLLSHQFPLMGLTEDAPLPGNSYGGLAVAVFFVISGYFVSQSWTHDPNIWRFIAKRLLRLIPGLAGVTLFAILVVGPLVTSYSLHEYFANKDTWKFLSNIYLKIRFELPGVFLSNPYPKAVNGSLWSLPLEVKWYGILAVLGLLRILKFKFLLMGVFILTFGWVYLYSHPGTSQSVDYLWYFGLFFLAGMILNSLEVSGKIFLVSLLIGCLAIYIGFWLPGIVIALPITVIYFGRMSTPPICNLDKIGDISYGVYLFAFPVQQTVVYFLGANNSYMMLATISIFITYLLALVSWKLLESPCLSLKKYFKPLVK
jgi:peptidoglycan/LPS O-acetylase OafA/YrhL